MPNHLLEMKIVESPILIDYRIEYYRGAGGYNYRWLIRKERIVEDRKIIISEIIGTIFCSPQTATMIRNLTNEQRHARIYSGLYDSRSPLKNQQRS